MSNTRLKAAHELTKFSLGCSKKMETVKVQDVGKHKPTLQNQIHCLSGQRMVDFTMTTSRNNYDCNLVT